MSSTVKPDIPTAPLDTATTTTDQPVSRAVSRTPTLAVAPSEMPPKADVAPAAAAGDDDGVYPSKGRRYLLLTLMSIVRPRLPASLARASSPLTVRCASSPAPCPSPRPSSWTSSARAGSCASSHPPQ